jgi:hypothetical protein
MVIPRSWSAIERQRDPEQARLNAEPVATDARFKTAAFLLFCGWLTTVFSLRHSIKHYKPRNRGAFNRLFGFLKYTPIKFLLTLPLSLVMVGYEAAIAFDFSISPLNIDPNLPVVFLVGWLPIALIFVVYEVAGYVDLNEDRELIRQRRIRGAEADNEIGITKKPHWWSRLHGDNQATNVHDAIARNVNEIGGGKATHRNLESSIEMGNMPSSKSKVPVSRNATGSRARPEGPEAEWLAASMLFPAQNDLNESPNRFTDDPITDRGRNVTELRLSQENDTRGPISNRSHSTNSGTTLVGNPQQIRSMLDV